MAKKVSYENGLYGGKVFSVKEKFGNPEIAELYRGCDGCKLKIKKLDIIGGHCSFDGEINVTKGKCTERKK